MKKTIFFFTAILFGVTVAGQSGDGKTAGTAYYGTISTPQSWTFAYNSGIIYVGQTGNDDLTVGTGGSLSIEAGVTVKFCTTASDLKISGSGSLSAIGTASSLITFTKNSQATWGHISFEGSTGSSVLDHCIIQYGLKSGTGVEGYGGGIHINSNSVSISNCQVHNNSAIWGGGIFVNMSVNPAISNCQIYSNTAISGGGGLYFWNYSFSAVINCIIYKNRCSGSYGGGGVFFGPLVGNTVLYNCTITSNTSDVNLGKNILFYNNTNTNRPKLYNTIIWGSSSNSIDYTFGQTPSVNDFNYCAIQGYTTGYTNCINLNATNNDPAGPNFYNVTAGSEDYRIYFISPCRDIGIATGAPATDILGNSRIGNYDIGAYEVQYSMWTGATSTSWSTQTNWVASVDPATGSGDVVIPTGLTNYPTGTPAPDFTIGSGKQMILYPGAKATLGSVINDGILKLESDSISGFSSLIAGSYSGNDATIELYLTGGGNKDTYKWHYISTPVSSLAVSVFAPTYTLDLAQWIESRPSLSLREGWVAYDGYIYSTGLMGGPTFSTLTPGKGYDYYRSANKKYTFSGQLNTGNVAVSLGFSGNVTLNGFNLLGNPFSSGLNWDDIVDSVYFKYPSNTSKGLYFTRDNVQCSYIGGVGVPGDVNGIIPPMQGFFNKTYSTGNTLTLPAAARIQNGIHPRYKSETIIPLVRLVLKDDTLSDETVVRFNNLAQPGLDNDYDAVKMFLDDSISSIYSVSPGVKYAINGQPFPDSSVIIPVVLNLTTNTLHVITASQLQGLDNYYVNLIDKSTDYNADLKTNPIVTFSAPKGTIAGRFILKVSNIATGIENPVTAQNSFNIYPANGLINIQTLADEWDGKTGSIKIMDLAGKIISNRINSEFSKNALLQIPAPNAAGIYIVELRSGPMKYVAKIIIR